LSEGTQAVLGARRVREAADTYPELSALTRPDGRCVVRPGGSWSRIAAAAAAGLAGRRGVPVLANVPEDDADALAALTDAGFVVSRREAVIAFEVATALDTLAGADLPAGVEARSAADVDEDALRLLDDELRQDIPGADGWRSTPEEFREHTFADPEFDPRTYLVAVDPGGLVGLARIWMNRDVPRLGMVGVRRTYRRRGIGAALVRLALAPVAETGAEFVTAEYDLTNDASAALFRRLGARRLGATIELVYDVGRAPRDR
jgi:ribosomal protein S18 acetylase RimI-like enzyme